MTSPIDRGITQCVLIATLPVEVAEDDVKDAAMTSPIHRRTIQCVLIATMPVAENDVKNAMIINGTLPS